MAITHAKQALCRIFVFIGLLGAALLPPAGPARGEDWPTYRHDNRRSGATDETLDARALRCAGEPGALRSSGQST